MHSERILVVGGSAGIGAAIASRHAGRALVWSRRDGVDATDPRQVETAARALLAEHGAPFALVHTVGDFAEGPILTSPPETLQRLLDSNLTSAWLVARAVVPAMVERGRGRVVLFATAGAGGSRALRHAPLYHAAKAALLAFARGLAHEVAPAVTVNVVSPGLVAHAGSHAESQRRRTGDVPLRRTAAPADVVGIVDLLLSDAGAYCTGAEFTVDGGLTA